MAASTIITVMHLTATVIASFTVSTVVGLLTMFPHTETISWICTAANTAQSFQIRALTHQAHQVSLDIYEAPSVQPSAYVETVVMTLSTPQQRPWIAHGHTADQRAIQITAFDPSVRFTVTLEGYDLAEGHCSRLTEMN